VRAYAQTTLLSDAERESLIAEHLDMARRVALRMARNTPHARTPDDLVSTAVMGLVEAANRFEPTHGEPFAAFALKRVRGAVLDELRRQDALPRRVRSLVKKAGETARRIEQTKGRPAEDSEVASALGVDLDEYYQHLETASNLSFIELDEHEGLGSTLVHTGDLTPLQCVERAELVKIVKKGLTKIPERDAQLLALYYVEEFTYSEIGKVLGVSAPRVCQLHSRALTRLRAEVDTAMEDPA